VKRESTVLRRQSAVRKHVATVRISAGRWKGCRLEAPPGARPTSVRAREALFDVLQRRLRGARVLDLFAGSGAIGLEAVSRGARSAVLVEVDGGAIEHNLARLSPGEGEVELLQADAGRAVRLLAERGQHFDIVFADPPYDVGHLPEAVPVVTSVLAENGLFVLQSDVEPAPGPPGLQRRDRRAYGRNVLHFFESESR
jgi:16S rRNA (guanine966-N2)-methyltransferase